VDTAITVTALGVYENLPGGLNQGHVVGIIRNSDQSLMGYESIPAGSSGYLLDSFQFLDLSTPFELAAGDYTIVQTEPFTNQDIFRSLVTAVNTDSHITFIQSARTYEPGFSFPTAFGGFEEGYFGPDFTFAVTPAPPPPTPTPEPATVGMLALGLSAVAVAARRKTA
jgi:hypothetical protein